MNALFDENDSFPSALDDEFFFVDADDLDEELLNADILIDGENLSDDENDEGDEGVGNRRNLKKTHVERKKHKEPHEPIKYNKKEENLFFLSDNQEFSTKRF